MNAPLVLHDSTETPGTTAPARRPRSRRRARVGTDELVGLLHRRDDLRGAYGPADCIDEVIRWGA